VLAVLTGQIESGREKQLQLMAGLLEDSSSTEPAKAAKITPRAVKKHPRRGPRRVEVDFE
jgi:hypothetical protein